jgi:hypothetical protein
MDEQESRRTQQYLYPRPPEEVLDTCIVWGFRRPEDQDWICCGDLDTDARRVHFRRAVERVANELGLEAGDE